MKLIYVAGPFRADTTWKVECNVRAAEEIGMHVIRCGGMPVIPHAGTRFFHGSAPDQLFIDGTAELLRRCDGMVLMDTWRASTGATAERAIAYDDGIPVFDWEEMLCLSLSEFQAGRQCSIYDFLKDWINNLGSRREGTATS